MDMLLLYHRLPYPPNKGEKTRAWQQVNYLSRRHRLWVACFVDDAHDHEYLPVVRERCHRFAAVPLDRRLALSRGGLELLRGRTLTEGYFGHRGMWQVVQEWTAGNFFDVALAFSSSMGAYLEDIPAARRVLDLVDLDSHKWSDFAGKRAWPVSHVLRTEAKRLARREIELIRRVDLTLVVNDRELQRVQDAQLRDKMAGFPTLMDLAHYEDVRDIPSEQTIGMLGTMDYGPNVEAARWFAEAVWPTIRKRYPEAQWHIVGRRPTREVSRIGELPGVTVTGAVEDVRPHIECMRVFAAPLKSDIGIPTKLLEALACGRPVVTTTSGHHGVRGTPGTDYLVADEPSEFAHAVGTLFDDTEQCRTLGRRGVQFMKEHYDIPLHMPRFEELLCGTAAAVQATA